MLSIYKNALFLSAVLLMAVQASENREERKKDSEREELLRKIYAKTNCVKNTKWRRHDIPKVENPFQLRILQYT